MRWLQPRRSRNCPGPRQSLRNRACMVGILRSQSFGSVGKNGPEPLECRLRPECARGSAPIGKVAVGKKNDGHHIFNGDPASLKSGPRSKSLGVAAATNRDRRLGIAPEERLPASPLAPSWWEAQSMAPPALNVADNTAGFPQRLPSPLLRS